uniref:MarR family transcriptional regulator n=1 Tax=Roseihalotalea indica TaxID=2867963 RepID=A0AA49GJM4_9BACT|nr:MarR family transcriptional regulator [Tunicatimonas sp. TK19036]
MKTAKSDNSLLTLVGKASRLMSNQISKNLSAYQVTAEQWAILNSLWKQDGQTQQQLANLTNKNKASITHLIDNLEKRKLVKRVTDEQDRRNKLIMLTSDGTELQDILTKVVKQTVKDMTKGLDKKELKGCRKALKKLIQNLVAA